MLYPHLSRMIENAQKQIQSKKAKNKESVSIPRDLEAQYTANNPHNNTGVDINVHSSQDSESDSPWSDSNQSQSESNRSGSMNDRADSVNNQQSPFFSVNQNISESSKSL